MDDLVIIGAGPAGLTAGLYSGLYKLNTLVIGETIGGQVNLAPMIFDYPGLKSVKGKDWLETILEQTKEAGVKILEKKVNKISKTNEKQPNSFTVYTDNTSYSTSALILTVGNKNRRPEYSGAQLASQIGIETTSDGFIKTNHLLQTNLKGIFAAGNCIAYPHAIEQLLDAAAQGAKAASQAFQFLKKQKPPILWGKSSIPQK